MKYPEEIRYSQLHEFKFNDLDSISRNILLFYIQANGQTQKERLEALVEGAKFAGFKYVKVGKSKKGKFGFSYKGERFEAFRQEIRSIDRWSWESEQTQIANILLKYRRLNKPWWKVWE